MNLYEYENKGRIFLAALGARTGLLKFWGGSHNTVRVDEAWRVTAHGEERPIANMDHYNIPGQ
jgi:hypothetical protein